MIVAVLVSIAAAASLVPLPGRAACLGGDELVPARCARVIGMGPYPSLPAFSPDGRNAYVASSSDEYGAVHAFRIGHGGALRAIQGRRGCVAWALFETRRSSGGRRGHCAKGRGLAGAHTVTVSPDGRHVYVAGQGGLGTSVDTVAVLRRDRRGRLRQLAGRRGCVNRIGVGGCGRGRGLLSPVAIALSPDGRFLYVAATGSGGVSVFARDRRSGALAQLHGSRGCVDAPQPVDGPDGCALGPAALAETSAMTPSPDGRFLYLIGGSSEFARVSVLRRDIATGELTWVGCVSAAQGPPDCARARGLAGATATTVSPDGGNLYVGASHAVEDEDGRSRLVSSQIAVFVRDATLGTLTQPAGEGGCAGQVGSVNEGCANGRAGLSYPSGLAIRADGRVLYAAISGYVVEFSRDPITGSLAMRPGRGACIGDRTRFGCRGGLTVSATRLTLGAHDRTLYTGGQNALAALRTTR